MQTYLSGHGVYRVEFHVVFCTKYRRRILNPGVVSYVRKLFSKIIKQTPGVIISELGIDATKMDHVHLVIVIPPKYSTSQIVGMLKGSSASELRKKFDWIGKVYKHELGNVFWSEGFFISTIGIDEKTIKQYVEWQGKQDSGQTQLNLFDSASL